MSGVANAGLLRVLPLTDRVRKEGNNSFIATVILQTSTDVDLTIAIHVTVSLWDPVRIPILFLPSRIQSRVRYWARQGTFSLCDPAVTPAQGQHFAAPPRSVLYRPRQGCSTGRVFYLPH